MIIFFLIIKYAKKEEHEFLHKLRPTLHCIAHNTVQDSTHTQMNMTAFNAIECVLHLKY